MAPSCEPTAVQVQTLPSGGLPEGQIAWEVGEEPEAELSFPDPHQASFHCRTVPNNDPGSVFCQGVRWESGGQCLSQLRPLEQNTTDRGLHNTHLPLTVLEAANLGSRHW